jgi:hypothetical protein
VSSDDWSGSRLNPEELEKGLMFEKFGDGVADFLGWSSASQPKKLKPLPEADRTGATPNHELTKLDMTGRHIILELSIIFFELLISPRIFFHLDNSPHSFIWTSVGSCFRGVNSAIKRM